MAFAGRRKAQVFATGIVSSPLAAASAIFCGVALSSVASTLTTVGIAAARFGRLRYNHACAKSKGRKR
jgi:hypothetical protein